MRDRWMTYVLIGALLVSGCGGNPGPGDPSADRCQLALSGLALARELGLGPVAIREAEEQVAKACPVAPDPKPPTPPPAPPTPEPPTQPPVTTPPVTTPPAPPTTTTPGPPAEAPAATGAVVTVKRHRSDGYMVSAAPTANGAPLKRGQWPASWGKPSWQFTECFPPGGAPRHWTSLEDNRSGGEAHDPFSALAWISDGQCKPAGAHRTRVRINSCKRGFSIEAEIALGGELVWARPGPRPAPCSSLPPPAPPPVDSPATGDDVGWLPTDGTDETCPRVGEDSAHRADLEAAVAASGITWPTTLREEEIFERVAPFLPPGLEACVYGTEEIALARAGQGFADVFDIKMADGGWRRGAGSYRSRCTPPRCSRRLAAAGPPPGPDPPPAPAAGWPKPVHQLRAKVHVPAAQRPGGLAVLDSVALWSCRGLPECECSGSKRDAIPACGCEADEHDQAEKHRIVACSAQLAEDVGLHWVGAGKPDKGGNAFLWQVAPGQRAKVCTRSGVCSAEVEGR